MATDTASNKPIGTISSVTGQARIIGADGTVRPAVAGDKIFMREMVFTTANATVQIQLENGQTVNVAADSEYVAGLEGSGGAAAALDQAAQKGAVAAGGVPGPSLLGSKVIGTIKDMVGEVKVTSADGTVRTAQVGDKVYAGETVASSVTGPVSIALEGGGTLQCDPGATLSLTPGILALAGQKPATDLAAIQAAIAAGADPTQVADATAAGGAPAAGGSEDGGGGHSFILLNQADSEGFVTAGFNTIGAGIGFPSPYYELAFFPSGNTVPVFPPATARVSEEGLSGGLPDSVGDQDTTNSATASGVNNIVDQEGGALSFTLSAPAEALTSDGQPIVWTGGGTNTLVGSVGESTIITITIDNLGNYNVTLSGSIDQPDLTVEDEISFEVGVTVDDGTNSTDSTITITVEDDAPVAHPDSTDVPEDAALVTYNVLANDELGSDGGHLTSASSTNPNITINGVTPEGDITFTVARGYEGPIVIDYVVTDHDGDHQTSQLTVNVGPDSTPSVAPVVKANDTQVYESALPDGSGGGSTSTDGSFEIDTGNDALARFEIQGANGAWIDVTGGGSVQGAYGTLLISVVDGAYTWTYTIGDNTLDHTDTSTADGDSDRGIADNVLDPFQIRVSDDDGDTSPEANLTIKVADDGPSVASLTTRDGSVLTDETSQLGVQVSSASAGVSFTTVSGADGAALDVSLVIDNADSGLFTTAGSKPITLVADAANNNIVYGKYDSDGNGSLDANAFTVQISDAGQLSVTQHVAMRHPDSPDEYDEPVNLAGKLSAQVQLTDGDGDVASQTIGIGAAVVFEDDGPAAQDDADTVAAGDYGPVTGNVVTDASAGDAGDSDAGADTKGADGAVVSAVSGFGGSDSSFDEGGNLVVSGQYGVLTINAAGDYSYLRNQGTPGGVTDTFTYTLTDGDGDNDTANLVISITDSGTDLDVPTFGEGGTSVNEKGLPARGSEAAGTGEIADGNGADNDDASETTSGTIGFNAEDGPPVVTIDGVAVTGVAGQQFVHAGVGTLTITSYSYDAASGNGTIGYSYTLTDNTSGDATHDDFAIVVTDTDGDHSDSTLVINIADDAPIPNPDTDSVVEGSGNVATGNVVLGGTDAGDANSTDGVADVAGADSFNGVVVGVAAGNTGTTLLNTSTVATAITGVYGKLTLNADGSYTYDPDENIDSATAVEDVFTYTIRDGDGDLRSTTLTISIEDGAGPTPSGEPLSLSLDDQNLASGSTSGNPDFDSGTVTFTAGSDALVSFAFDTDLTGLNASLTWTRVSDTLVRGSDERGAVVELTLTGPESGSIGVEQTGGVTVTATLLANYDTHPTFTLDDLKELGSVDVVASDQDGDSTSQTVSVSVSDDVPVIDILPAVADAGPTTDDVFENADPISGTWTHDYNADQDTNGDDSTPATIKILVDGMQGEFDLDEAIVVAGKGTLTVSSDGTWSFDPVTSVIGIQSVNFTVRITDVDGDVDEDSHTVRILDANSPSGAEDTANPVDEEGLANGIPDGTGDVAGENESVSGTLTYLYGNDGAHASTPFVWSTAGLAAMNLVTSADESPVSYAVVGGTTLVAFTAAGSAEEPDVFTLTLNPVTKGYTFTLHQTLEHDNAQGSPGIEDNVNFTFGYTIMDADGSTDTGFLALSVDDDMPLVTGTTSVSVDEEGLSGNTGDSYTDGGDLTGVATTATGDLGVLFGADGAAATGSGFELSADYASSWDAASRTLSADDDSWTIVVGTDGTYTFTLLEPLTHTGANTEDDFTINVSFTATDADGDTMSGGFTVTVDDDAPVTFEPEKAYVDNAAGNSATFKLDFDGSVLNNAGADEFGSLVFSGITNGSSTGLTTTLGGVSVAIKYYVVDGTTLVGATGADATSGKIFSIALDPLSGTYTVQMFGTVDSKVDVLLDNLGFATAGNKAFNYLDVAGTTEDLLFSGYNRALNGSESIGTVNTNNVAIGVDNQSMNDGDNLRIDFVNSPSVTGSANNTYDYASSPGHYVVNDFSFSIVQKGGNTGTDAIEIWVRVYSADNDDPAGTNTQDHWAQLDDDTALTTINVIKVNDAVVPFSSLVSDGAGGWLISGLDLGDRITVSATGGYNRIEIENARSTTTTPATPSLDGDSFDIGQFAFEKLSPGSPVNLDAITLKLEDKDGDASTGLLNVLLEPSGLNTPNNVTGDANANTLYGAAANDTLDGAGGNDSLDGGSGSDSLIGGTGNDILVGGLGNDTMTGGDGADTFRWEAGDHGTLVAAVDRITDFGTGGTDVLNLQDLLVGETHVGTDPGNLANFLSFSYDSIGNATTISVHSMGTSGPMDQQIVLQGVDITSNNTLTSAQIITSLLTANKLITD